MILIDSGFLIALIDRQDELHPCAMAWLNHFHNETLTLNELVLVETYNFFAKPANRSFADRALRQFLANPMIEYTRTSEASFEAGRILFRDRPDKGMVTHRLHFIRPDERTRYHRSTCLRSSL